MKRNRRRPFTLVAGLSLLLAAPILRSQADSSPPGFEELSLHLEVDLPALAHARAGVHSLLDLPAELVLAAESEVAVARIEIFAESGRSVLGARFDDAPGLGVVEVELECEAHTLGEILRAMPPGSYRAVGSAIDGSRFAGALELFGHFPGWFQVLSPAPYAPVDPDNVLIAWTPSQGADHYELEIESAELGTVFFVRIPAGQTSFQVPPSILSPDSLYDVSLTVSGDTDNELEAETSLRTADY